MTAAVLWGEAIKIVRDRLEAIGSVTNSAALLKALDRQVTHTISSHAIRSGDHPNPVASVELSRATTIAAQKKLLSHRKAQITP